MESQDMIGGIQKYYPEMEIIYYDLGLSKSNKEMVRTTTGNSHKSKQLHVWKMSSFPQQCRKMIMWISCV